MSYTTIDQLPERLLAALTGSEYLLLTTPDTSYKLKLSTLNDELLILTEGYASTLTNKVINDVSNYVHANAVHFKATTVQAMTKGTPVKLTSDVSDNIYVDIATASDRVIGFCENDVNIGVESVFVFLGLLSGIDTSAWAEGDLIYFQSGALTNAPNTSLPLQSIGYVVNSSLNGDLLINNLSSSSIAADITLDNTNNGLVATNVQTGIDELSARGISTTVLLDIINDEATLPSVAVGDIINNIAFVYKTPGVITEYSCAINVTFDKVVFDPADNLNGYTCTVSYYSK